MELNKETYYSQEANQEYLSASQYSDFMECEHMALAKIRGEYNPPPDAALLAGSLLHSWNDGTMEQFKKEHPEMFSSKGPTKGELKSEYQIINRLVETLEDDPFCMLALEGDKEVIMTAEMFGAPWKIRMDVYNTEYRRITDLKSTRSINELVWSNERWAKVSFIDAYNYVRNMAIYCEVERINAGLAEWCEPYIVAVSKEDPPDKAVISLQDDYRFKRELAEIEANVPRILKLKAGLIVPRKCGKCAWCRQTKKITQVTHYTLIGQD